jgi:NTP pyrophosphatase (non-canonical NTP hydrolase)
MKLYQLIEISGVTHLRLKNPLEGTRMISEKAFAEHERLYIESALPFPKAPIGRQIFTESEVREQWQFRERINMPWQNVSEPAFIGTGPEQYRLVYTLVDEESYQERVIKWVIDCFGAEYAVNIKERALRLLEEVVELGQSLGVTKEDVIKMAVHTYGRPVGDTEQEFGGVMVTLAALAASASVDLKSIGEKQLSENIINKEKIKEKHLLKIKKGIAS